MSDSLNTSAHYRACLTEMVKRLAYPGSLSAVDIVRNGKTAEAILYILDRLDQLEANHGKV
jgi:hypothetical protein